MKKVKMPTSDSYQDYLIQSLQDPEEAAAYIEAILEVENPETELLTSALKDVIDAQLRINHLSAQAKLKWEELNQMLLKSSGAEIYGFVGLLDALGFKLEVREKS